VRQSAFNNHIFRSKWNYQFTPAFSFRVIAQYSGLLANPAQSSLTTTKNMNFDFLFTYMPHPGTAVYVGYNSNLENLVAGLCNQLPRSTTCAPNGPGLVRSDSFINDGRHLFENQLPVPPIRLPSRTVPARTPYRMILTTASAD
jgi:hypothetical protein